MELRQPLDGPIERVADENAEHDGNDDALRVLKQHDTGNHGEHRQRDAADVHRRFDLDRRCLVCLGLDRRRWCNGDEFHFASSSACSALLIATAALMPSATATTTNCASRDASPATKTRGTFVSQREPVSTVPRRVSVQPSRMARSDCGCWPVLKKMTS